MVVVAHLAPGVNDPVKAFAALSQDIEPQAAVCVTVVDVFTPVTARGDVVKATGYFYA
jgi:hypothetical protein